MERAGYWYKRRRCGLYHDQGPAVAKPKVMEQVCTRCASWLSVEATVLKDATMLVRKRLNGVLSVLVRLLDHVLHA